MSEREGESGREAKWVKQIGRSNRKGKREDREWDRQRERKESGMDRERGIGRD
jgi:hypothetical protein